MGSFDTFRALWESDKVWTRVINTLLNWDVQRWLKSSILFSSSYLLDRVALHGWCAIVLLRNINKLRRGLLRHRRKITFNSLLHELILEFHSSFDGFGPRERVVCTSRRHRTGSLINFKHFLKERGRSAVLGSNISVWWGSSIRWFFDSIPDDFKVTSRSTINGVCWLDSFHVFSAKPLSHVSTRLLFGQQACFSVELAVIHIPLGRKIKLRPDHLQWFLDVWVNNLFC